MAAQLRGTAGLGQNQSWVPLAHQHTEHRTASSEQKSPNDGRQQAIGVSSIESLITSSSSFYSTSTTELIQKIDDLSLTQETSAILNPIHSRTIEQPQEK
ncbi:hypothetical protein BLOT_005384 [Blomia tropicalis]|nr:hypothetical protein BLOT_005384 [Blomia tropicalis]